MPRGSQHEAVYHERRYSRPQPSKVLCSRGLRGRCWPVYSSVRCLSWRSGLESLLVSSALGIGCLLAGLGGLALRPRLSEHHLDDESRGVVSNITGLIAAMAALLLGLLVASAQSSYNTVSDEVDQMAANLVELDRTLDALGPATADVRALLRQMATTETDRIWPLGSGAANPDALDAWRMDQARTQFT